MSWSGDFQDDRGDGVFVFIDEKEDEEEEIEHKKSSKQKHMPTHKIRVSGD